MPPPARSDDGLEKDEISGLTPFIPPEKKARTLPFRDSYQTAIYDAAVRAVALASPDLEALPPAPLRFEISRYGPRELAVLTGNGEPVPGSDAHRHDWWNWQRIGLFCAFLACVSLILLWSVRVIGGKVPLHSQSNPEFKRDQRTTSSKLFASSWMVFIISCLGWWLIIYIISYFQAENGEPFKWFSGASLWPTEIFRAVAASMAVFFLFKTHRALQNNAEEVECRFCLSPPRSLNRPVARFLSREWRTNLVRELTLRSWDIELGGQVDAQMLWNEYTWSGSLRRRILRIAPLAILCVAAGVVLMQMLGTPFVPLRGTPAEWADRIFLFFAVVLSIVLTLYVADATVLNRRLIHYLSLERTWWPSETYAKCRKTRRLGFGPPPPREGRPLSADRPPNELLEDYLDIELIALRTETVSGLIYYPFVVLGLMVLSRISLFDDWDWPLPLLLVMAVNGSYAAWSAFRLRNTAEKARKEALLKLSDLLIAVTASGNGNGPEAGTIREIGAAIRAESRGAFAPISRHPIFGAILLPSGGVGIWALAQYLPNLFR